MKKVKMKISGLYLRITVFVIITFIFACTTSTNDEKSEDALKPINMEDISVEGPMQTRALANYDRLEDEVYYPENVFPEVHEQTSVGWPGDKEGRIMLALTLQARATNRTPQYLDEMMEMYPEKMNEKGYLGPIYQDTINEQQLSGHGWLLRALSEYYFWKEDPKVKEYIERIITNLALPTKGAHKNYPIEPGKRLENVGEAAGTSQNVINNWILSSDIGCDFIFMDGVIQAYQIVPSEELKELIDEMVARFLEMNLVEIKVQTHATLTALRGLVRYYEITGDESLLKEAEKRYDLYKEFAMTENYENFNWFGRPEWTEPCAIIDSYVLAVQLWQHTRNPVYLEDAQHIYFNAIAHTHHANGGFGLDHCVGPAGDYLDVRTNEAYWCCTMRGGEGMAKAIQYNYFTSSDTLFVPFYNSNTATINLASGKIKVKEITDYPFRDEVVFRIVESTMSDQFTLSLFLPSWTKDYKLYVNEEEMDYNINDGFMTAMVSGDEGTVIKLKFDIEKGATKIQNKHYTNNDLIRIHYGPLLLGYEGEDHISLNQMPELISVNKGIWKVKGEDIILSPVYHLLDPDVWVETDYTKQILFEVEDRGI